MPDPDIHHLYIQERLEQVNCRIDKACTQSGRDSKSVLLLAVSKTKPLSMVKTAMESGQIHFGENYLQDALDKISTLSQDNTTPEKAIWHFIGAIQSNKTRQIAEHFDWVHTVSTLKTARRLNEQRPKGLPPINILIQVNIDEEENKSGIMPDQTEVLMTEILSLIGNGAQIRLRGLMAIPSPDQAMNNNAFSRLATLKTELAAKFELDDFDHLSMGMSADLDLAIAAGSTIVRVGTDIFGSRGSK